MKFNVTELVLFPSYLVALHAQFLFCPKVSASRKISFFPYDSFHVSFCQLCFFFFAPSGICEFRSTLMSMHLGRQPSWEGR